MSGGETIEQERISITDRLVVGFLLGGLAGPIGLLLTVPLMLFKPRWTIEKIVELDEEFDEDQMTLEEFTVERGVES